MKAVWIVVLFKMMQLKCHCCTQCV